MKSVLASIQPKYCELISNGSKTIEVRKNRPKLGTPFKCYIYCTKGKSTLYSCNKIIQPLNKFNLNYKQNNGPIDEANGKVIGEFVCDNIDFFDSDFDEWANNVAPVGSQIDSMGWDKFIKIIHNQACISDNELNDYFPEDIKAYLWHISDLKIYDRPKELREFKEFSYCGKCKNLISPLAHKPLSECDKYCSKYKTNLNYYDGTLRCIECLKKIRPPQSWQYIESLEDK